MAEEFLVFESWERLETSTGMHAVRAARQNSFSYRLHLNEELLVYLGKNSIFNESRCTVCLLFKILHINTKCLFLDLPSSDIGFFLSVSSCRVFFRFKYL